MSKLHFIFTMLIIIGATNVWSEIYTWTDENGKTHFGDKPPKDIQTKEITPKNINIMNLSNDFERRKKEGKTFKKDSFNMPLLDSKIPYRFVMTRDVIDNEPVDRINSIQINNKQKYFVIYVKFTGIEKNKEYKFRSRVIDAKGELIFDKNISITSTGNSMGFVNRLSPSINIDTPGQWTFQGILDGRSLYVEKRNVNFHSSQSDRDIALVNAPKVLPPINKNKVTKVSPPARKIKLLDGSYVPAPQNEEEIEALKVRLLEQIDSRIQSKEAAIHLANPNRPSMQDALATNATSRNRPCPVKKDGDCSGRMLKGADYSRLNIFRMTFAGANLENADFSGSQITPDVTFAGANLKGADFSGSFLNNIDFAGADLTNADFTNITCSGCTFDNANLTGAEFSGDTISHITFKKANLKDIRFSPPMVHWITHDYTGALNFDIEASGLAALAHRENGSQGLLVSVRYTVNGCDLGVKYADCSNKDLSGHRLLPVDIENVNFTGANLSGTDLSSVRLKSAVFDGANLDNAKLPKLERFKTSDVSFRGASLKGALFIGNTIVGDFTNADLTNTDLSDKDVRSANFKNAVFSNTKFDPSQISIANLSKANIDNCEQCQQIVESGSIDVEQLKRYFIEGQDYQKLIQMGRDDPEAYKAYRKSISAAHQDLALLSKGQGILEREELVDLLVTMLSTDNPTHYKQAYRIIDRTDEQNYRALKSEESFVEPLCADPKIIKAVTPLLSYTKPKLEEKKNIPRRSVSDADIRELSTRCLLSSDFEQKPDVHQALIDKYKTEEDNQIKRMLLASLTERRRDETLPLLINAIKTGDNRTSNIASRILGDWKEPPAELIPWLTEKFRGNRNVEDGWRDLLVQYGGMTKDAIPQLEGYYQELQDAYKERHNKTLHDHKWHTLIFRLKRYSEVNGVTYGLNKYDRQTVLDSYIQDDKSLKEYGFKPTDTLSHLSLAKGIKKESSRIIRWVRQLKEYISSNDEINEEMKGDITNPFYSEKDYSIQLLAQYYGMKTELIQHIKAISCVEYKTRDRHGYGDTGRLGIDVFRASSDRLAIQIGQFIADQKQPRRLVAQTGELTYVIWGDPWNVRYFDLLYSDIRNYGRKHKSPTVAKKMK